MKFRLLLILSVCLSQLNAPISPKSLVPQSLFPLEALSRGGIFSPLFRNTVLNVEKRHRSRWYKIIYQTLALPVTPELIHRVRKSNTFQTKKGFLGFTGLGPDIDQNYPEFKEHLHDERIANIARLLADRYELNADVCELLGLLHNPSLPFRHFTSLGPIGRLLKKVSYSPGNHMQQLLNDEGIFLTDSFADDLTGLEEDDIAGMSPEGRATYAADKLGGTLEDLLFGLKFNMYEFSEVPVSLKEMFFQGLSADDVHAELQTNFDAFFIARIRLFLENYLDASISLVDLVRFINDDVKKVARAELIQPKIFSRSNTPQNIEFVFEFVGPIFAQLLGISVAQIEQFDNPSAVRNAIHKLSKLTDFEVVTRSRQLKQSL